MKSATQSITTVATVKANIEQLYIQFRTQLEEYQTTIQKYKAVNSQLSKVQADAVNSFSDNIENINSQMHQAINGMVWDNLVIAFFGETNAGKSTTIETLRILFDKKKDREKDGTIVGDGRQDFTKTYAEYQLNIYGQPFTLIDVPGIEGKEEDFKDDIKRALQQAHLVFYVQGHNKKPDAATAAKIKKYLNDWVNVYSIYNVRDSIDAYEDETDRKTLLTKNVNDASLQIEDTLQDILGDVYKGNISLQGLLALCSKADFSQSRKDLAKMQKMANGIWGNSEKVYQFSNFEKIVKLIQNKTEHFDEELIAANIQKIVSLCHKVDSDIETFEEIENTQIEKLRNNLKSYQQCIESSVSETKSAMRSNVFAESNQMFAQLQDRICGIIDNSESNDRKEYRITTYVDDFIGRYNAAIRDVVKNEIEKLNKKLKDRQKGYIDCFKNISGIQLTDNAVYINIDSEAIVDELRYTFSTFAKQAGGLGIGVAAAAAAGATLGSVVPGLGTVFGAAIGWGIGQVAHSTKAIICHDDEKDAKREAAKVINKEKSRAGDKLSDLVGNINAQIKEQTDKITKGIAYDLQHIRTIQSAIEGCKEYINNFAQDINQQ